jgi:hypothetical protein
MTLAGDPGPWMKFWWKGVDIVADVVKSVLAAAIIATTAYVTWKHKTKREHALDLKHEDRKARQAIRIADEVAAEKKRFARAEFLDRLAKDKTNFDNSASC